MIALALAALLLTSCVTTQLPPASQAGPAFQPLPDEVELWSESRAEERTLRGAVDLYDDPYLLAYLQDVVDRLTPPGMEANPHLDYTVSVIDAPELNAFAYPHGAIYVHTGLLAKLENEDQLATLLGHEMSHVEGRHMLRHRRAMRNRDLGFSAASIALAIVLENAEAEAWWDGDYGEAFVVGVLGDLFLGLGLQLAFVASVNGYGRDLEWEADRGGIAKLDAAGYRLAEAPRFYETLRDNATSPEGGAVNFFFGSHPRLTRRAEVARELVAERGDIAPEAASPEDLSRDDRSFRSALAPVVRDQGWWHLAEGRLEVADEHMERAMGWAPRDPLVHLLKGQLRLAQSQDAPSPEEEQWLRDDAARAFLEAIRLDPDLPEAHRDLGFLMYEDGDPAGACRELGFYLELAPDAEDAGVVREYVADLQPLGVC